MNFVIVEIQLLWSYQSDFETIYSLPWSYLIDYRSVNGIFKDMSYGVKFMYLLLEFGIFGGILC
ncbi:hypothetical protein KSS87_008730 [Heliosperma pusillum]|nr:hypothetical protein KSS87_008730 [Heliosperma pusillum]